MSRDDVVAAAAGLIDSGAFQALLERRVAYPTESQNPDRAPVLLAYLEEEMVPALAAMGFSSEILPNPSPDQAPFLIASRLEDPARPTVLVYGHGDTVRGQDAEWREGLAPWRITVEGDRWYGRGTADNKGQHSINLSALEQVIAARNGKLGFNVKLLLEMGEETGSPGLAAFCDQQREKLAADVLIASDGPRLAAERPTIFLGSRGAFNVELRLDARQRGFHSGNWGGVIRNPATILASAIASMVDAQGRLLVEELRPRGIGNSVRAALADVTVGGGPSDPEIDAGWGEPGLSPAERLFAWNTLEVLAMGAGNPAAPVNAVPPSAMAVVQLRFVVGTDPTRIVPAIQEHLAARGFGDIQVISKRQDPSPATRLDPEDPWVVWAASSIRRTTGSAPAILPNIGGTLPNHVFAEILALPTVWIPHSYAACSQHAPDEHILVPLTREALAMMAGIFFDLGEDGAPGR
ncbi:M20 family metallopeptidase [Roseomonas sp. 18066]|uniref:M20 family metallopeptidase n=1 Tax=Roseomonas sp. 18066 TaxID=2681412 RepID=UPI00135A61CA|nr:M20 family metallopeptidase [Roseomonas sp. 18066]